ncbi:MAG: hydrogenase maturation protease [Desulfurococcaceae archaeon]
MQDLCSLFKNNFLVVGVGSPLRSDDQAGLLFCKELSKRGFDCLECEYGIENCFNEILEKKPSTLIVVDAALFEGGNPGNIIVAPEDSILAGSLMISTHTIPISVVINLLKSMNAVKRVYLVGIYPGTLELGTAVSREVTRAIEDLVDNVEECIIKANKEEQALREPAPEP